MPVRNIKPTLFENYDIVYQISAIVENSAKKTGRKPMEMLKAFYCSGLYEDLSDVSLKTCRFSIKALENMFYDELDSGKYSYPDED